jgi:hypothetical protein
MSVDQNLSEKEEFRVLLVLPSLQMVLAEHHGRRRQLPRIKIPKWTRTAQQLSEALYEKWGVRAIVIDLLLKVPDFPSCAVVEVRTPHWRFILDGFIPVHIDDLDDQELTQMERFTLQKIIAGNTQDRGPFSRLGWLEEAQEWIRDSVHDRRVEFNGDVRQVNASGLFALVRFETFEGPAYWLKATGAPNTHELSITQALSRYCPDFVPPLIAARSDWNAWVTEEAGQPLRAVLSLQALEQAAHSLARLQITSCVHVKELLVCGCFDQRMPVLRKYLPYLVGYLEDAMSRQTSTKVFPLSASRLHKLGYLIEETSIAMEAIGVPDSLIHNDMNPGNILYDGTRVVFTDWSEAGIGSPFLTFQQLQAQALTAGETHTCASSLKAIYRSHWRNHLSESQIDKAFVLSPPLAIASCLCGRDPSFSSAYRSNDSVRSFARSMARCMDRLAQAPEFMEAICG